METLIVLVAAIAVFVILWYAVWWLPLPDGAPKFIKPLLYVLLLIVAAVFIWQHFVR